MYKTLQEVLQCVHLELIKNFQLVFFKTFIRRSTKDTSWEKNYVAQCSFVKIFITVENLCSSYLCSIFCERFMKDLTMILNNDFI